MTTHNILIIVSQYLCSVTKKKKKTSQDFLNAVTNEDYDTVNNIIKEHKDIVDVKDSVSV